MTFHGLRATGSPGAPSAETRSTGALARRSGGPARCRAGHRTLWGSGPRRQGHRGPRWRGPRASGASGGVRSSVGGTSGPPHAGEGQRRGPPKDTDHGGVTMQRPRHHNPHGDAAPDATYHTVPGSFDPVAAVRTQVIRPWRRALQRRSQRRSRMDRGRMDRLAACWLPPTHILHPWPERRFDASTRGRNPVR